MSTSSAGPLRQPASLPCGMCSSPLPPDQPVYLVSGWRPGRTLHPVRHAHICGACYAAGAPDPETGLTRATSTRTSTSLIWDVLAGATDIQAAAGIARTAECTGCGRRYVCGVQRPRRTCSEACARAVRRHVAALAAELDAVEERGAELRAELARFGRRPDGERGQCKACAPGAVTAD